MHCRQRPNTTLYHGTCLLGHIPRQISLSSAQSPFSSSLSTMYTKSIHEIASACITIWRLITSQGLRTWQVLLRAEDLMTRGGRRQRGSIEDRFMHIPDSSSLQDPFSLSGAASRFTPFLVTKLLRMAEWPGTGSYSNPSKLLVSCSSAVNIE